MYSFANDYPHAYKYANSFHTSDEAIEWIKVRLDPTHPEYKENENYRIKNVRDLLYDEA